MTDIKIRSVLVSECYTNCYLCMNTDTKEGFIVDPGGDQLKISTNISDMGMKPTAILLTHGHKATHAADLVGAKYNIFCFYF